MRASNEGSLRPRVARPKGDQRAALSAIFPSLNQEGGLAGPRLRASNESLSSFHFPERMRSGSPSLRAWDEHRLRVRVL
ncbi:hypothetical protein NSPZN2_100118 [Nitrospira defluvii]|uniref:Uncharacterized protein n=1 Tax=Nitrospira defluvii TaxID=330214 RepID=A0ABN7L1M3_9BACT|nr:hypothetical protein NSPZN2_100118 [Nitrospira defluvii]